MKTVNIKTLSDDAVISAVKHYEKSGHVYPVPSKECRLTYAPAKPLEATDKNILWAWNIIKKSKVKMYIVAKHGNIVLAKRSADGEILVNGLGKLVSGFPATDSKFRFVVTVYPIDEQMQRKLNIFETNAVPAEKIGHTLQVLAEHGYKNIHGTAVGTISSGENYIYLHFRK